MRHYDAAIARWIVVDPVTHHDFSPYQAFDNNPVFWADPSGADAEDETGNNTMTFTGNDAVAAYNIIRKGWTSENGANTSNSTENDSSEECCGGANNMARTYIAEKLADRGFGSLTENYKDLQKIEGDAAGDAAVEAILLISGEWAIIKVLQGGKWVYRLVQAKRILKNSKYVKLATANITNSGKTVLGHFDTATGGYIGKAKELGASYFDIGNAWNALSKSERWALNKHFLNTVIQKGDQVIISVRKAKIKSDSYLAKEINYLINNGYKWVDDFTLKNKNNYHYG